MRLRAGLLLCLFALSTGLGCRKPLTLADNNQAPETWITSAPQDTITLRDKTGKVINPEVTPGVVPVQYHLFWAGSDIDGAVAGYYYAVVETTAVPPPGIPRPELPGPKPRDYHFTLRTDTTFIFNITVDAPDRQHAFFIYAVDNKGRPDATPARFIFSAQDNYPPSIAIDTLDKRNPVPRTLAGALSIGTVWAQTTPGTPVFQVHYEKEIKDTVNLKLLALKDTVAANGVLSFRWHAEPRLAGTFVTGFQYKLEESQFVHVDSSTRTVTYNSGTADHISPGAKQFTVRATDFAGGARQTTRRFKLNLSPSTWYSGPDVSAFPYTHGPNPRDIYYDLPSFAPGVVPSFTGSLLSSDSVTRLPAIRTPRRTFFEIYKNRIYVRSENDTVNMNSWVVLGNGGFDADSPYLVKVSKFDPALPSIPGYAAGTATVLYPDKENGSPIGFKGSVNTNLTPDGPYVEVTPSKIYPNFDPGTSLRTTTINGYYSVIQAGKAYALVQAVDGFTTAESGGQDRAIPESVFEGARTLADHVDFGFASGQAELEKALRPRVLTFFVDKVPYLLPADPSFKPVIPDPAHPQTVYPSRVLDFHLVGTDDDPYDTEVANKPSRVGGPSPNLVLRWSVSFKGKDAAGADFVWKPIFLQNVVPSTGPGRFVQNSIVLDDHIVGPAVSMEIELCDCRDCELSVGSGRCVNFSIPITVPAPPTPAQKFKADRPGPGSSNDASGRDVP